MLMGLQQHSRHARTNAVLAGMCLQSNIRLDMYSLGYYSYSSATPGAALYTDGEVSAAQTQCVCMHAQCGTWATACMGLQIQLCTHQESMHTNRLSCATRG